DWSVTGVQTCALPICFTAGSPRRFGSWRPKWLQERFAGTVSAPTTLARLHPARHLPQLGQASTAAGLLRSRFRRSITFAWYSFQIGRASCRQIEQVAV